MKSFMSKIKRLIRINKDGLLGLLISLGLWEFLAISNNAIIFPKPSDVFNYLLSILMDSELYIHVFVTLQRLTIGLFGGIMLGSLLGISISVSKICSMIFLRFIYFLQSVPPILFVTIAMVWFGMDGEATVFLVSITTCPIMAIALKEGWDNIDGKLMEVAQSFQFSKSEVLWHIILPSLKITFKSTIIILISLGWKMAIMGEVFCSGKGIGAQIMEARLNLETYKVFAWGFMTVLLCIVLQKIVRFIYSSNKGKENDLTIAECFQKN